MRTDTGTENDPAARPSDARAGAAEALRHVGLVGWGRRAVEGHCGSVRPLVVAYVRDLH